jgi:hypothetical protein
MKRLLFILPVLGTLALLSCNSDHVPAYADNKPQTARYQLIYAVTRGGKTGNDLKGLWKIDTVTGQVWRFNAATEDVEKDESVGGFIPVRTGEQELENPNPLDLDLPESQSQAAKKARAAQILKDIVTEHN